MGEERGLRFCEPGASWQLRLVGRVEVSRVGTMWETSPVGSRKALTLMALLGAYGDQKVTLEDIVDALWEGAPPQEPAANVATLVSRLRARFGLETIVGRRSGYRLGSTIQVDLHEAAALVTKAEKCLRSAHPAHGLLVAEQAIKFLVNGQALAEYAKAPWAADARALQESLLRRARHAAVESALRTGAPMLARALSDTAALAHQRLRAG
jgi:DNA-binding SARP family transcriptional activator